MLWRRGIRSALFIDYENVSQRALPDTIASWVAWLEEGEFEVARRPRRLMTKRIYWNSAAEPHREKFERAGFEAILCEKFAALKNGADIRMAMDILETTYRMPAIEEYILVTKDSDFIPVLQRLGEKRKSTVMLVDEAKPSVHTAVGYHADTLIPVRKLAEATRYVRPAGTWRRWWAGRKRPVIAVVKGPPGAATDNAGGAKAKRQALLEQAVARVVRVTSRKPKQFTAQKAIEAELRQIEGFVNKGQQAYLGTGSYRALMQEIARLTDRIQVRPQGGGGTGVLYMPKDDDELQSVVRLAGE